MKITTATGLKVEEPLVNARIDGGVWAIGIPLSEVLERYSRYVDLDILRSTGYQQIKIKESTLEFKFA